MKYVKLLNKLFLFAVIALGSLGYTARYDVHAAGVSAVCSTTSLNGFFTIEAQNGYCEGLIDNMPKFDLTTSVNVTYTGSYSGNTFYDVLSSTGTVIEANIPYTEGTNIDLNFVAEQQFLVSFKVEVMPGVQSYDSTLVSFNHQTITTDITIDPKLNPSEGDFLMTTNPADSTVSWKVVDANGNTVLTGTTPITQAQIDSLPDGQYTFQIDANTTTIYGNPLTATDVDTFEIKKPQPIVTIPKPVNPDLITGEAKYPDSNLTWEITDSSGNVIATGDGVEIPLDVINTLEPGDYNAIFTETNSGLTAIDQKPFSIVVAPAPQTGGIAQETGINPTTLIDGGNNIGGPILAKTGQVETLLLLTGGFLVIILSAISINIYRKKV